MKTMLHLLSETLITLFILIVSANSFAGTKWDVAVLFFGKNEDSYFQKDIQNNLKEIKKIDTNSEIKVSVYNETKTNTESDLKNFLKKALPKSSNKKMLVIYSHGLGPVGLKDYSTIELKNILQENVPHLDLMWFDACFMANVEFLYELRNISEYTIASEDAEFSSGLPFESIEEINNYKNGLEAGKFLVDQFLTSYSYLKDGKQKENVQASSATISLFENSKLKELVTKLKSVKEILNGLPEKDKLQILTRLQKAFSMDNNELIDLGHLLIEIRMKNKDKIKDSLLTDLIRLLNISSVKSLKTNPRIKLNNLDTSGTILVYGFNNWTRGDQKDFSDNKEIFDGILKADGFIKGQNGKMWPYKKFTSKNLIISPFAPNINSFDYLIISKDGTKVLKKENFERKLDLAIKERQLANSPLVYFGYTQEIGKNAEKYTGINITRPNAVFNMDYLDFEFNALSDWATL